MKSALNSLDHVWINSHEIPSADLTVEVETIDVTPMTVVEPDPKWTHIDTCGHFHAFTLDGTLPTIKEIRIPHRVARGYDPDDPSEDFGYDEWTETVRKCRICAEVIEPQYREHAPTYRETRPGRQSWKIECRWPGDLRLPAHGEVVSIRVQCESREFFGTGMCVNRLNGAARDLATVEFFGEGELGSRKLP